MMLLKKDKFSSISIFYFLQIVAQSSGLYGGEKEEWQARRAESNTGEHGIFLQVTERANFSFVEIQLEKNGICAICHGPPRTGASFGIKMAR